MNSQNFFVLAALPVMLAAAFLDALLGAMLYRRVPLLLLRAAIVVLAVLTVPCFALYSWLFGSVVAGIAGTGGMALACVLTLAAGCWVGVKRASWLV